MINAGKRVFPNILERDPTRRFQWNRNASCAHNPHGFLRLSRTHIIQKQRLRSRSQSLLQLNQTPYLARNGLARGSSRKSTGNDLGNSATQSNMVALDQNSVGKIEALAPPPAATHCILVEYAKTGSRLTRVENFRLRARHCIHIL